MDADPQRLAALKEELRKDLEALERVEKLLASKNGSLSRPDERQYPLPIRSNGRTTEETTEDDLDGAPVTSLRGTIDQIINADPNIKWTTQKVLNHLQSIQYPLRAQKPIYSVGQALQILAGNDRIRLVRRGTGSAPNIYKGKLPAGPPANAEDHSGGDIAPESTITE